MAIGTVAVIGSASNTLYLNGLPTKADGTSLPSEKIKCHVWLTDGTAGSVKKGSLTTNPSGIGASTITGTALATALDVAGITSAGAISGGLWVLTIDGTSDVSISAAGYSGILKVVGYDDDDDNYLMYIVLIVLVVYLMNKRR
jgi:hypothetical protein